MNLKRKTLLLCLMLVAVVLCAAGCRFEETPYALNDAEGYNVSVQFNANGGTFTVNAPIITDSFNISDMSANSEGKVEIPLLAPDDPAREKDAFKPVKNGYFLAGWYAVCEESTDAEGNKTYTYAEPWNFETDRLTVDPKGTYASETPVLTLYAAWAPLYQVEFCDVGSGEVLKTMEFDPGEGIEFKIPAWDEKSGAMEMYKFPGKEGYTFNGAFYDPMGTVAVEGETVTHPGTLNKENATVENGKLQLYVDWTEGQWYRISTAEQFVDNFSLNGSYEISADLDFADEIWPTAMMYGSFTGTIRGNGHTISNVSITQTDNGKANAGLFGQLGETAVLSDVTFENITFTVKKGARMTGTAYGLLCGTAADGAVCENVAVTNSAIVIDPDAYFATDDYAIGLVCGMGTIPVDYSGITCTTESETFAVLVNGNTVTLADPGEVPDIPEPSEVTEPTE